jgi:flagellar motility protein MotE (MotC chaperone)
MVRKLATVVVLLLAIHAVAIGGGVAFLFGTGKLDGEKLRAIAKLIVPDATPPATQPAEKSVDATTQPLLRFDDLLGQQAGKTTSEQVQFLRETFDGMSVQLDRQRRELLDLKRQVDLAQSQVNTDRAAIDAREMAFAEREEAAAKLAADEGFKRAFGIYQSMTPKQLKDAFTHLDDALVARYLQRMEPKRVAAITAEFKTPQEKSRAIALLERLRVNDPAASDAAKTSPVADGAAAANAIPPR